MFKHLHIVACSPRSGTTLLHEAMVTCFKVDKHYDHEVRFNLVDAEDDQIVVTKRPKDTMYMPDVIDDPGLFVLYVMRDPRDVIVSRHGKNKDMYYSNIRLWRELHAYARQIAGHDRFLQVSYEEFVSDPDAVQRQIAARFPWLETLHKFSEYHEYANVSEKSALAMNEVRPIAPTSVGKWKNNLGRIKGQQIMHGSLTPDLIECGYESSDAWEQVLDGVEPDFSKSRYPEKVYFWSRISQRIDAWRKVAKYRRTRRPT
jgi:hypothetical protein